MAFQLASKRHSTLDAIGAAHGGGLFAKLSSFNHSIEFETKWDLHTTYTDHVTSNLALILCMFCLRPGALMIPRLPRSKDLGSLSPWHCSVKNRKGCMASWSFSSPAAELFNHQLVGISLFFDLLSCGDLKAEPSERKRSNLEAGELSATANSNNQLDSWSTVPSMRHFILYSTQPWFYQLTGQMMVECLNTAVTGVWASIGSVYEQASTDHHYIFSNLPKKDLREIWK